MTVKREDTGRPAAGGCAFLTPKPNGKGYVCAALTELLCRGGGKCKFRKAPQARHD